MPFIAAIVAGVQAVGAWVAGLSFWAKVALQVAVTFAASKLLAPRIRAPEGQGTRQQLPPATDNKVPVLYGDVYMQGIITHAEIANSNKTMYYVMVLGEAVNTAGVTYTVDEVYYNDEKLAFSFSDPSRVVSGSKEVDGVIETNNNYNSAPEKGSTEGNLYIRVYAGDGSGAKCILGGNTNAWDMIPSWASTHRMEGLVFAVVKLNYNADKGFTGLAPVTFKIRNTLTNPALVWKDYMTSKRYGAGLAESDLDSSAWDSGNANSWYSVCNQSFSYTDKDGDPATQPRYQINGVLDTSRSVKDNIDAILSAAGAWMTFNTAEGKWKIIQKRPMNAVMTLDDDIITSQIQVGSTSLTDLYNSVEVEFPSRLQRDQNDYVRFAISNSLRHPNEPDNKLRMRLDLVNNNIQAEIIGNIELRQSRDDLVVTFTTTYEGLQLEAGDVVNIVSDIYGWNSAGGFASGKPYRITRIREIEDDSGNLMAEISALEYNADVYTDEDISEFTTAPNFNVPGAGTSGRLPAPGAPQIIDVDDNSVVPSITLQTTMANSGGPFDRVDIYYSLDNVDYQYLTTKFANSQTGFFEASDVVEFILTGIPTGTYYFKALAGFERNLSSLSAASAELSWSPVVIADPDPGSVAANLDWFPNPLVIPADSDGSNPQTGQKIYLRLLLGTSTVDISTATTDGAMANDSWRVVTETATGITVGTVVKDTTNNRFEWTVTGSTAQTGNLTVSVKYKDGAGTVIDLGQTVLSVTQLRNGQNGITPKSLRLLATSQTFTRPKGQEDTSTSLYIPNSILFTALTSNINETVTFSASNELGQNVTLTGTGSTRTLTNTAFGNTARVTVTASVTSGGTVYEDKITVARLREGDDGDPGINAILTNESHGVPTDSLGNIGTDADSDGIIDSLESANTFMRIYEGITDVTDLWTFSDVEDNGKETLDCAATITTTGVNKGKIQVTNLTGDVGLVTATATRTGYSPVSKTFTVTKQKQGSQGADGVSAVTLTILSTAAAFIRSANGTDQTASSYVPTTITFYPRLTGMASPLPQVQWYVARVNTDGTIGQEYLWQTTNGTTAVNLTPQNFISFAQGKTNGTTNDPTTAVANSVRVRAVTTYQGNQYQDFNTVYKLIEGDNGIAMILSNEAHTVPANAAGTVSSFAGASTNVRVFAGSIDDTANWTFSVVNTNVSSTLSGTPNGSTVTVTAMPDNQDSGFVDITATKGSTAITKRFTITKTKQGVTGNTGNTGPQGPAGANAKIIYLSSDKQSITFNRTGQLNPSSQTVTFTATTQNMTGTPTFTATAYNASNVNIGTISLGGSGNTRTLTGAQFTGIANTSYVVVTASLEGLTDTVTVVRLAEGQDGVTPVVGYLTNESALIPADYLGNVTGGFAAAGGTFKVFNGITDVTTQATFTIVTSTGGTASIGSTTGVYTVNTMTADLATFTFQAAFGGVTLQKILTVTKSRAGIPGASAEILYLTSDKQSFIFNSAGQASPTSQDITFTATLKNFISTVTFSATGYNSAGQATGSLTLSGTGNTRTLSVAAFGSSQYAVITATAAGNSDSISVVRLQQGVNGVTPVVGYLTNESAQVASDSNGIVTDWTSADGQFKVFSGTTDVTSSCNFSIVSQTGTTGATIVASGTTAGAYSVGSMTSTATNIAVVVFRANYQGTIIDKEFTLTKSRAGAAGVNAKLVYLAASALTFTYDNQGNASPSNQSINLIANLQNLSGTVTWSAIGYNAAGTQTGTITLGGSGNARTISNAAFGTNAYAIVTASIVDGGVTYQDTVTIVRLEEGRDGIDSVTGYLTNESVTLAADSAGTVTNFAPASGNFKVFKGITDVTAQSTFTLVASSGGTATINSSGGGYSVSALTADAASFTFRAVYQTTQIEKILTVTKSRAGAQGPSGPTGPTGEAGSKNINIFLYQWNTVQPAAPNSTSNYDWNTGLLTYGGGGGWSTTVPANPGTPGIRLWAATRNITAANNVGTTSNISWAGSTVYAVGANGANGADGAAGAPGAPGAKSAVAVVYRWNPTIPLAPTGSATWSWTSNTVTTTAPTGWQFGTQNPVKGSTLWAAQVFLTDTATATTTAFTWNNAGIVAVGYAGNDGAQGPAGTTGASGASYRVCYSKTTLTSLSSTPAFVTTTGPNTFPSNGTWGAGTVWQQTPPAIVAGESVYQSDGIYDPATNNTTWYAPYLSTLKVGSLSAISANLGQITSGSLNINNNFIVDSSGNATIRGDATVSGTVSASKFVLRDANGVASSRVVDPGSNRAIAQNPQIYVTQSTATPFNTVWTQPSMVFVGPNLHANYATNQRFPRVNTGSDGALGVSSEVKILVNITARVGRYLVPVVRVTGGTITEVFNLSTGGQQTVTYSGTWRALGATFLIGSTQAAVSGIAVPNNTSFLSTTQYIMRVNQFGPDSVLQFGLALTGSPGDIGSSGFPFGSPGYEDSPTSPGTAVAPYETRGQNQFWNLQYNVIAFI